MPNLINPPAPGELRPEPLRSRRGLEASVHLIDRASALAINAALVARRPLLVEGETGIGKSQLARAAADILGRALVHHTVNSRTETDELLWTTDLVARLAEAQLSRDGAARERLALGRFVRPGPLWWAFDWTGAERQLAKYTEAVTGSAIEVAAPDAPSANGVVVLVDELDKADASVPNGLLDALGHRGFDVPGVGRVCLAGDAPPPLVVFTTNKERRLPDAFLRRCFVLSLALPEEEDELKGALQARGDAHNDARKLGLGAEVVEAAVNLIVQDRLHRSGDARYRPGVAELLDLLAAVAGAPDPAKLVAELGTFVVDKQGLAR